MASKLTLQTGKENSASEKNKPFNIKKRYKIFLKTFSPESFSTILENLQQLKRK